MESFLQKFGINNFLNLMLKFFIKIIFHKYYIFVVWVDGCISASIG